MKVPNFKVLANDLNPEAVACMRENIKLNKVEKKVLPFCMDARDYARMLIDKNDKSEAKKNIPIEFLRFDHIFMNLPMIAVEFLDVFIGLFNEADPEIWKREGKIKLPIIHVYGFTAKAEPEVCKSVFVTRIGKAMNFPGFASANIISFHQIRDVSGASHMFSTSF